MIDVSARRWPFGVAAVLFLTMAGNAAVYWAANDPNAAAVEPDYYRKAVQWDSTLAQGERNRALGWSIDAALGPRRPGGGRNIRFRLRDVAGAPVPSARIELTAIHNAFATRPVEAAGVTDGYGTAWLDVPLGHDGLWELRVAVSRGIERFTATLRRDTEMGSPRP